jgi:hypothetical protein
LQLLLLLHGCLESSVQSFRRWASSSMICHLIIFVISCLTVRQVLVIIQHLSVQGHACVTHVKWAVRLLHRNGVLAAQR